MQIRSSKCRWWLALTCLLAVFVVSGVQAAHWDAQRSSQGASAQTASAIDGLCPICYSVPVGHGAAPAAVNHIAFEGRIALAAVVPQSEGTQPEFHLHIRPPPSLG